MAKNTRTLTEEEINKLNADINALVKALEPFARDVGAVSLSKALGHISREHLLAARDALADLRIHTLFAAPTGGIDDTRRI